jgi:hypothetical protein
MPTYKFLKNLGGLSSLALTGGQRYRRLAEAAINKVCRHNSLCVDVCSGAGDILNTVIRQSPGAIHYSFEADEEKYFLLVRKFGSAVHVYNFIPTADITAKNDDAVAKNLDNIIPPNQVINLIVLGFETEAGLILHGASRIIKNHKPVILFSVHRERDIVITQNLLGLLDHFEMQLNSIKRFLKNQEALSKQQVIKLLKSNKRLFLIAY